MPPGALPAGLANETRVDRWTFDPISGVGELGQAQRLRGPNRITPAANPEVWKEVYGYEALTARPSTVTTTISEGAVQTLNTAMDYDIFGRPGTHTYPSPNGANRLQVKRGYTSFGQLASLSNAATNQVYWTANAENAWGHVTSENWLTGALTGTHADYDSTGQSKLRSCFGGGASDQFNYQYSRFGNLTSQTRSAAGANVSETYTYDALQRLTGRSGSGDSATYAYTKSGNLTEKSDFSLPNTNAYTYPVGKHGVTGVQLPEGKTATYGYDANGNLVGGNTINATYDSENKLRTITRAYLLSGPGDKIFCNGFDSGTNSCTNPPGGGSTTWTYGSNGERSTEQSSQGLRYFGPDGYELINGQSKHELGPVLVTRVGAGDTVTIELKDRLGSTVDTITGASATLRTFDAFGAVRNGNLTPRHNGTLNLSDTIHGFTGHTHADDVGLVHMKGRVYDPNLGRFLSVDPIVGSPASQSLNPYSYLANRPLSGTDPTGYDCQEDKEGAVASSCLLSNNGVNKITDASGKALGTVVVTDKGSTITANFSNGGSLSATFTGKTGNISRALNGPPSDIGAISQMTNGTLAGTAASYALGTDKSPALVDDWGARQQQTQRMAEFETYRQWTFAHEGLEPVAIHPFEAAAQNALGVYNEIRETGGLSAETAGTLAVSAMVGMMGVPVVGSAPKSAFHQAASALTETGQRNIRTLRGWAESKGWSRRPGDGPETWGVSGKDGSFSWRLKIKSEAGTWPGLNAGSQQPRFDARLDNGAYVNPFTGETGARDVGTHLPLEQEWR